MPFTVDQFFAVFAAYNEAVWPLQWVLHGIAAAVIALTLSTTPNRHRWIAILLSFLWAWSGLAYHLLHFSSINPAAYVFGFAFLVQAGLLVWFAVRTVPPKFSFSRDLRGWLAVALIVYALAVYPALGAALGHDYPAAPTFGVPCPTTIFTLGMLSLARGAGARVLLVVPALWAVVGGSAAFLLHIPQDVGLIAAGLLVVTRDLVAARRQ